MPQTASTKVAIECQWMQSAFLMDSSGCIGSIGVEFYHGGNQKDKYWFSISASECGIAKIFEGLSMSV